MLESVQAHLGHPARVIQDAIMADLRQFVGDAPNVQRDDIAVAVVVRNEHIESEMPTVVGL